MKTKATFKRCWTWRGKGSRAFFLKFPGHSWEDGGVWDEQGTLIELIPRFWWWCFHLHFEVCKEFTPFKYGSYWPTKQPTKGPAYSVVLLFQKLTSRSFAFWRTAWRCHLSWLPTRWIVAPRLRQCGLSACFHVLRRVAQFERSSSGNSWKWTRVQARLHWGRWCSCEPARVLVCRCRSALEQFTQSSTVTRKAKACRARRKREGAVHLVILEQLLGPAFSVLLGENNSIKGTRGSIITEWGDSRQLPAWLWKPFQILQESPHITCCSCWDHLGEMQNLAPTHPSRR